MDKTSIIGIILGLIAVGVGMVLKGADLAALVNPAAILIIFVGTAASIMISFPMNTIKRIPTFLKIIFTDKKSQDLKEVIILFVKLAETSRKEGLLALEKELKEVNDPFLASGLQLVIDGHSTDFIREVMDEKVYAMERRHEEGALVFSQAGTYAPTLGVLGAVIGLIAALKDLNDMATLGHAISAAFIATLFGIFTGYVLWHPFASKLKEKSKKEIQVKEVMIEGILSLTNGESPLIIKDKLSAYLSSKEIVALQEEIQTDEKAEATS
ncbi:flagellar motor stator protein MotA [Virgibacillus soli]|uniref:flagellar motor stator protein MotA n=1 Tax=Paracerasibacillus soli TaxID=480284 RepID=UPI0035EA0F56